MRYIKIYLLGLLASTLLFACENDNDDSGDCTGTTISTSSTGYDNKVKSTVEYYNKSGYLKRVETNYFDSKNNNYVTYEYDSDNRLVEFFRSWEGYSKYYYESDNK